MKTAKILLAAMATICAMTVLSCSKDTEESSGTGAARTIEGSYKGDIDCSVMGSVTTFEDTTFAITAEDDSTVTIVLPPFGEAPMALPSITIPNVKVTENAGVVTLVQTETSGTTDNDKAYTCTLSGSVENNTLDIRFNLTYGAMPMPMICSSRALKL